MKIAVYLASSDGNDPQYRLNARQLGTWIGLHGHELVYGGAGVGTMSALADAVLEAGGRVTGVIPSFMCDGHRDRHDLSRLIIVKDMSERKKKMMNLADAFCALPGGPGTLEEVSEVISSLRLGLMNKKCILLSTNGFYDPLIKQFKLMKEAGFLREEEIPGLYFVRDVKEMEAVLEGKSHD